MRWTEETEGDTRVLGYCSAFGYLSWVGGSQRLAKQKSVASLRNKDISSLAVFTPMGNM